MSTESLVRAQDGPLEEFPWGHIRWSMNAELAGSEHLTVGRVEINPRSSNPRHYHPNCDEVVYVVSGRIAHLVDEDWYEMEAGDSIHVPQGVWHQGRNDADEPAILVISYNTGRRQIVVEGLQSSE